MTAGQWRSKRSLSCAFQGFRQVALTAELLLLLVRGSSRLGNKGGVCGKWLYRRTLRACLVSPS